VWLHLPGARVDLDHLTVHRDDGPQQLTRLEASALRCLAESAGQPVSRERLEREVWGYGPGVRSEAVPVAMRRLRAKLGSDALLLVRGEGWRLADATVEARPSAQPERDAFVGREAELAALAARFSAGARVVTLLGTVGTGKSRLARRFLAQAPWQVVSCPLADARSADALCTALAAALSAGTSSDPIGHLGRILGRAGPVLVLLDDADAVAPIAGPVLERWLQLAPEARFLVTSRGVLGLRGEALLAVEPLPVPAAGARTAAEVLATDAGRLLAARAAEACPGFALSDADAPAAALLLARLEGLPLAIELATARLRLMPLAELVERMRDRFRLLVAAGRSDRQATLRAAIAASWDLLAPWEAAALAQLSVFEGSFDLPAAEAVLDLSPWPEAPWTPDVAQSLVDRSLLRREPRGRLRLYAAIAEFAAAQLGDARAAETRHGAFYAAIGARERPPEPELDNLVVGFRRAAARGDAEVAADCAVGAALVLCQRGPARTALEMADAALALAGLSSTRRRRAMRVRGRALHRLGRASDALAAGEQALTASREAGDPADEARALAMIAMLLREVGRPREAADAAQLAVTRARELGDAGLLASPMQELGSIRAVLGDAEGAREAWNEAIRAARTAGDVVTEALAYGNSGIRLRGDGRLDDAASRLRRARDLAAAAGHARGAMAWTGALGLVDRAAGRSGEARARLQEAADAAVRIGDRRLEGVWLGQLGALLTDEAPAESRDALERARSVFVEVEDGPSLGVVDAWLALLDAREGRAGAVARVRAAAERTRSAGVRVDAGLVLAVQAEVEARAGDVEAARRLLTEVEGAPDLVRADPIVRAQLASARRCLPGA
jgi:predicted ATPase